MTSPNTAMRAELTAIEGERFASANIERRSELYRADLEKALDVVSDAYLIATIQAAARLLAKRHSQSDSVQLHIDYIDGEAEDLEMLLDHTRAANPAPTMPTPNAPAGFGSGLTATPAPTMPTPNIAAANVGQKS